MPVDSLTPEERATLHQCLDYILRGYKHFVEMDDRLFENILKIDRNLLYFFFDKWYSTDFSVGHEEEPGKYEKKILYAIEIMLSYMEFRGQYTY